MALGLALAAFGQPIYERTFQIVRWAPLSKLYSIGAEWPNTGPIVMLFIVIWVLDRRRRYLLVPFAAALLLSATFNETIKRVSGRGRPEATVRMGNTERVWIAEWIAEHPRTAMRLETRDQWLWLTPERPLTSDKFASFPSGHANAACVMGIFLCILYPQLRWLWVVLAVATALARVQAERHFPSDVLFAAGLAWIVAQWVFTWRRPVEWGMALERWARRKGIANSE
jgi:membrane-associated phospholipid phosphatase